jgi:hypothetical protein
MFRIQMHALWSQDYIAPLARMLARVCECSLEEAEQMVSDLSSQKTLVLESPTPAEANFLARDLLQFGVFVEVEQIGPITPEAMRYDAVKSLPKSLVGWYVQVDEKSGNATQLIEQDSLATLRYEYPEVTEELGQEMLSRGAIPIDGERMSELDRIIDRIRPQYVTWEKEFMAERIRKIKQQRQMGQPTWMEAVEQGDEEE